MRVEIISENKVVSEFWFAAFAVRPHDDEDSTTHDKDGVLALSRQQAEALADRLCTTLYGVSVQKVQRG